METTYNVSQLNSIIKHRRSIYPNQYEKGKIISDEIIWQILENANHAPNHKQTEPWRFKVFSGEGLKYFGELQANLYKQYSEKSFNQGRYNKLIEYPLLSSHVVSIGMKRNERGILPEIEEIEAVACAVQNMFLTATAYGLGSYWTTAGITYYKEAKTSFGLGENDKLLGFFYIGALKEPFIIPSKRNPVQTKVEWIDNYSNKAREQKATTAEIVPVHDDEHEHDHAGLHENKTGWVVILTIVTMILEISIGYYSRSMALTAEGWHMFTHVFAIGLTWLAYLFARKYAQHERISFRRENLLSLGGFTSALVLQTVAILMAIESIERLINPVPIKFGEAIYVAFVGLIVNVISAKLLHHDHSHSDSNIRSAYLHVLSDGITGLVTIIVLSIGMYYNLYWLDSIGGILGSFVITGFAVRLIKNSGSELIQLKKNN